MNKGIKYSFIATVCSLALSACSSSTLGEPTFKYYNKKVTKDYFKTQIMISQQKGASKFITTYSDDQTSLIKNIKVEKRFYAKVSYNYPSEGQYMHYYAFQGETLLGDINNSTMRRKSIAKAYRDLSSNFDMTPDLKETKGAEENNYYYELTSDGNYVIYNMETKESATGPFRSSFTSMFFSVEDSARFLFAGESAYSVLCNFYIGDYDGYTDITFYKDGETYTIVGSYLETNENGTTNAISKSQISFGNDIRVIEKVTLSGAYSKNAREEVMMCYEMVISQYHGSIKRIKIS